MLVLSRALNEVIVIRTPEGRVIRVQYVDRKGIKIRLGIEADRDVQIDREEIAISETKVDHVVIAPSSGEPDHGADTAVA